MSGYNGHHHIDPMSLGLQLGEIKAETRRQTEIILSQGAQSDALQRAILDSLTHLPGQIASTLPSAPPSRAHMLDSKAVIAILQALPPVLFLFALIAAKASGALSWPEIIDRMRQVTGG